MRLKAQLNVLEQLWLRRRAYHDVRHNIFQERNKEPDDQECLSDAEMRLLISPLINTELSRFEAVRDHALGEKKVWGKTYNDCYHRRLFRKRFSEAISFLDQRTNVISSHIETIAKSYEEQIQQWQGKKVVYEQRGESHMVQLAVNKTLALRMDYYKETVKMYRAMVDMLSEKIKLLDVMEGYLRAKRGHTYLRIRYYYQMAVSYAQGLSADYLDETYFAQIANVSLLKAHESVRTEAQKKLQTFRDEIAGFEKIT